MNSSFVSISAPAKAATAAFAIAGTVALAGCAGPGPGENGAAPTVASVGEQEGANQEGAGAAAKSEADRNEAGQNGEADASAAAEQEASADALDTASNSSKGAGQMRGTDNGAQGGGQAGVGQSGQRVGSEVLLARLGGTDVSCEFSNSQAGGFCRADKPMWADDRGAKRNAVFFTFGGGNGEARVMIKDAPAPTVPPDARRVGEGQSTRIFDFYWLKSRLGRIEIGHSSPQAENASGQEAIEITEKNARVR